MGLSAVANADDGLRSRMSLKGIRRLRVVVQELHDAPSDLSADRLKDLIERRLKENGIEIDESGFAPFLSLRIETGRLEVGTYIYRTDLALDRYVFLVGDPYFGDMPADTWSLGSFGTVRTGRRIREVVNVALDRFLQAYLSVNPPRNNR